MLLGFLGGLGRLALAGFARCRVVDLADVVGLDRERLVLYAVSRVRLGLDLAWRFQNRCASKPIHSSRREHPRVATFNEASEEMVILESLER